MKLPSITNATLTAVNAAGFTPDYDEVMTVGAVKWSGTEEVYFSEVIVDTNVRMQRENASVTREDILVRRSVVVDSQLPVSFVIGDILTLFVDGNQQTGVVQKVTVTKATGLPGVTRLVFVDG